ncbi:MAG: 23S rRNA (adenine(2503)-C(2))-methyltransferase RlmN [Candidatus Dormibacteraeota bacterium]|nr:23S rRNA (adenine(2503)-C(2))-methyltransferase RlmN [Candidatus Dormibacteraeota bacterium]
MTADPLTGATRPAIGELSREQLNEWLTERGEPPYRVRQLRRWLAQGHRFERMDDLPAALRGQLADCYRSSSLRQLRRSESDGGLTTKVLYELDGGYTVEAVVMRYPGRSTLCISSQVGCPIGCPFCATGQGPFGRNLRPHEILDQAVEASRELRLEGRRLSHVVFMGMGEPLANYASVLEAVRRIADPDGLAISPRRITISTAGLVPRITGLSEEGLPVTLAISLHAARDELRDELVPINRRYPLSELMAAADGFARKTGRRVSYEWVLLAGVNDTDRDAEELTRLLRGRLAHVNLIPFNPVPDTPYREPSSRQVHHFAARLRAGGLTVTVRDTRGRDSEAACGQLRARVLAEGATLR